MLLENLRYYREVSNMTYEQLSEESKTPLSTIKNIYSGKNEPLVSTLQRIAKALNVTLDVLLADANAVVSSSSIIEVKETVQELEAEQDNLLSDNQKLQAALIAKDTEIQSLRDELARRESQHKDELIALVKYFTKIKPQE